MKYLQLSEAETIVANMRNICKKIIQKKDKDISKILEEIIKVEKHLNYANANLNKIKNRINSK